MASAGFFTFGILFWAMGHSLALDFLVKESPGGKSTLIQCFFPKPKQGKFVSYVAMFLGVVCVWQMIVNLSRFRGLDTTTLKLLVPGLFVTVCYIHYLLKRLRRIDSKWFFIHTLYSNDEWKLPIALFAFATFVMFVLHSFFKI
jgi:hypothetical protein